MSDDEDVVYQGSPLYESLALGGSIGEGLEFEVCMRGESLMTDYQDNSPAEDRNKLITKSTPYKPRWTELYLGIQKMFGIVSVKELTQLKAVEIIECVMLSANMEDDDADFLRAYLKIPQLSKPPGSLRTCLTGLSLMTFPVLCTFGLVQLNPTEPNWWSLLGSAILTCATGLTLPLGVLYMLGINKSMRHRRGLDGEYQVVKDHVKTDEQFSAVLKRSLRLIQEKELIARGFTLVSQKNPISRLEEGGSLTSATRQCPGLRKLVFHKARQTIYFYREVTKQLIDISVSSECDVRSSYLAYEPLQSYGPCLQPSLTEDDSELYTITDGFSVSALKGICHLLRLHQSEFLKAMALVYSHNLQNPVIQSQDTVSLLQTSGIKLGAWVETVKESYDFHNCSILSQTTRKKVPSQFTHISDVQTAIHSLDLHLQSALTRVQTFSAWLETKAEDSDVKSICCQGDDIVKNIMEPIRAELESCKGCWEESNIRIERMMGKKYDVPKEETSTPGISLDEKENTEVKVKALEDYIIVDQVFEAYTDPNDLNNDDDGWEKPLTAEEKEKLRREKLEALRMLTELKSVISVRAVDTEKRERAAILRAHPERILDTTYDSQVETENQSSTTGFNSGSGKQDNKISKGSGDNKSENDELFNQYKNAASACENHRHLQHSCTDSAPSNIGKSVEQIEEEISDTLNKDKNTSESSETGDKIGERHEEIIDKTDFEEDVINYVRNPLSYVSSQGVRRLRKSNMLDLSDSDSDAEITRNEEIFSDKIDILEDETVDHPNFGLPLINRGSTFIHEGGVDSDDSDQENNEGEIGDYTPKQPLSFKERLSQLSGANLDMSLCIAAQAVARSRQMGVMPESTFGGEVFGEHSSSESENES